eukprot:366231-Chlamydomonas_euryale.AAC.5
MGTDEGGADDASVGGGDAGEAPGRAYVWVKREGRRCMRTIPMCACVLPMCVCPLPACVRCHVFRLPACAGCVSADSLLRKSSGCARSPEQGTRASHLCRGVTIYNGLRGVTIHHGGRPQWVRTSQAAWLRTSVKRSGALSKFSPACC